MFHVDPWGPYSIAGYDGTTKIVLITDDASRRIFSLRIASTGHAPNALKQFTKTVQKKYNYTVRSWRVDDEFYKGPFSSIRARSVSGVRAKACPLNRPYLTHIINWELRRGAIES